jgi:uncharacterized membrane protein (DUF485 family)
MIRSIMKKSLLQLPSAFLILILLGQAVYADIPPPGPTPEEMNTITLGIVIGLGVLVIVIVLVAVLVIKAIKKRHSATESAPVGQ